jgi:hypothetical protein
LQGCAATLSDGICVSHRYGSGLPPQIAGVSDSSALNFSFSLPLAALNQPSKLGASFDTGIERLLKQ